jgi:hypothetical protein
MKILSPASQTKHLDKSRVQLYFRRSYFAFHAKDAWNSFSRIIILIIIFLAWRTKIWTSYQSPVCLVLPIPLNFHISTINNVKHWALKHDYKGLQLNWILEGEGRCMLREQITKHIMMCSLFRTVILLTVHGAKLFIYLQHFTRLNEQR